MHDYRYACWVSIIGAALLLIACDKDEQLGSCDVPPADDYPECVEGFIATTYLIDKSDPWSIETQCVDDQLHYRLNTGAPIVDGVDYIVNGACDTVCFFGGWDPPESCLDDYDEDAWVEIWRG